MTINFPGGVQFIGPTLYAISAACTEYLGSRAPTIATSAATGARPASPTRRVISEDGRRRIAEAQKLRWSKKAQAEKAGTEATTTRRGRKPKAKPLTMAAGG